MKKIYLKYIIVAVACLAISVNSFGQEIAKADTLTWDDGNVRTVQIFDLNGSLKSTTVRTKTDTGKTTIIPKLIKNQMFMDDDQHTVYDLDVYGRIVKIQPTYNVNVMYSDSAKRDISYVSKIVGNYSIISYDINGYIAKMEHYNKNEWNVLESFKYCDGNLCEVVRKENDGKGGYIGTLTEFEYTSSKNSKYFDMALSYSLIGNGFSPNLLTPSMFGKPSANLLNKVSMSEFNPKQRDLFTYFFAYGFDDGERVNLIQIDSQFMGGNKKRENQFIIKQSK